jgi:hypothetical protein
MANLSLSERRRYIELLHHGCLCEITGDYRKRYCQGGGQMTADRLRITSGRKSALRHFALAVVCAALMIPSTEAETADLVVWWEQGFYAQEDEAVREIIGAFEQETGKEVELVQPTQHDLPAEARAAVEAGQPPDFVFGIDVSFYMAEWAFHDRLVNLSNILGSFANMFDPDALDRAMLVLTSINQRAMLDRWHGDWRGDADRADGG